MIVKRHAFWPLNRLKNHAGRRVFLYFVAVDAAGHLGRVDYPNNDWVKKEYSGNLVSKLIDAAGTERRFSYQYDNRDQLTREVELTHVDDPDDWLEGPPNTYSYDHAQNRVAAVRAGTVNETYGYSIANKMTNIWRGSQSA